MPMHTTDLDSIARQLAAAAGVYWDELNDYPGYTKNIWREQARVMISAISPTAVFREDQGSKWDRN